MADTSEATGSAGAAVSNESADQNDNSFDALIQNILSSDYMERELYIRKNHVQVVALVRWFAKTIVQLEQLAPSDDAQHSMAPEKKPKLTDSINVPAITATATTTTSDDQHNYASFMLSLLVSISSAATGDDAICTPICDVMLEPAVDPFLRYLNDRVQSNTAFDSHLAILVNFTRYAPIVERLISTPILDELAAYLRRIVDALRRGPTTTPHLPPSSSQSSSASASISGIEDACLINNRQLLSAFLTNLTQSKAVRAILVGEKLLNSLMIVYEASGEIEVRRAILCIVRNCCFDGDTHPLMITEDDDELLIKLVYPLAGPEELATDETERLPLDLQYLPRDKSRERSAEMRELLLESLLQLCHTRYGRERIRASNIYLLLREYHKWETDSAALLALENVIDVLIKTESELSHVDNLKRDIEIPAELIAKFAKLDQQLRDDPTPAVPAFELAAPPAPKNAQSSIIGGSAQREKCDDR